MHIMSTGAADSFTVRRAVERDVGFKVQVQQVSINRLIEIAGAVGKWETSFAFQLFHGGLLIISRHILCMRVCTSSLNPPTPVFRLSRSAGLR
jgi:hypothetical protein